MFSVSIPLPQPWAVIVFVFVVVLFREFVLFVFVTFCRVPEGNYSLSCLLSLTASA